MTAEDVRLVADAIGRAASFARADLLRELPIPVAAAFLREEALWAIGGTGPLFVQHRDLAELDIMVRFHRLCQIRPSLRKLYPTPKEGNRE